MRRKHAVLHRDVRTVLDLQNTGIRCAVGTAVIYIMRHAVHRHVGAVDGDAPSVIGASADILRGDRGKRTSEECQRFRGDGTDPRSGDLCIIPDDRRGRIHGTIRIHDHAVPLIRAVIGIAALAAIALGAFLAQHDHGFLGQGDIQLRLELLRCGHILQYVGGCIRIHGEDVHAALLARHLSVIQDKGGVRPVRIRAYGCGDIGMGDVIHGARLCLYGQALLIGMSMCCDDRRHIVGLTVALGAECFICDKFHSCLLLTISYPDRLPPRCGT